jgi:hypothetical protein
MIARSKYYLLQLGVTVVVVGLLTLYIFSFHEGEARHYRLYYFLPAAISATLFVFDRISRLRELGAVLLGMDILLGAISLTRVKYPIPFYSGHALFLTYTLLTVKDRLCLAAAAIVLLQTAYLKVFVWGNDASLYGGILLGCLATVIHKYYLKKSLLSRES